MTASSTRTGHCRSGGRGFAIRQVSPPTPFSPASGDAERVRGAKNGRVACRAGFPLLPRPIRRWSSMRTSWMLSRRILSATRDRRVEPGIQGCRTTTAWLGRARAEPGPGAQRLRCRRRERLGDRPSTERSGTRPAPSGTESPSETTTEPTRPPRTSADTQPDDRTPLGRASQLADDPTRDLSCWHAGYRRGRGAGSPWLDLAHPPGCRADWRLAALEVAQEVGLGRPGRRAGGRHRHRHRHPVAVGPDRGGFRASGPCRGHQCGPPWLDLMRRWDLLAERAPDDQRRKPDQDRSATCSRS